MYEEKDYILRLIHEIVRMLAKLIFGKDIEVNQVADLSGEVSQLYQRIIAIADNGDINSAEDILIENLDFTDIQYLYMSLLFYHYLNEKPEGYLLEHDFSKAEILDGIKRLAGFYGYEDLISVFSERTHD